MVVGDDWKAVFLWKALYEAGVFVNVAIHPAVPPAGALLRTSVMATHDRATLDRALQAFAEVKRSFEAEHGPLPPADRARREAPAPGVAACARLGGSTATCPLRTSSPSQKNRALSACHRDVTLL